MRESKKWKTYRFGQVSGDFESEIESEYLFLITFDSAIFCRVNNSSNESW